ncbi:MAG: phosphate ABC transporter ATP-binding protein [Promethearchaeota archaeon]|nr:MAG: phosphate ABC transporter ATP-binding protein [Candidatus Lokiarchaeota archaeon]
MLDIKNNGEYIIQTRGLNLWFGDKHVLKDIDIDIQPNKVTALIGPSGCGKTTLIRTFNRMNDIFPSCKIEGEILYHGMNIYSRNVDAITIRTKIGMIFQKPNPFPMSVFENIAYGPKVHGEHNKKILEGIVEKSLKEAALWNEINDRLRDSGLSLSGGQQQRLCIARTLAIEPEVILMDEPCSALDPISTAKIEDLINELKKEFTVIIVTHNMQQAARISDYTGFMYLGELVEYGDTIQIFENPKKELTERYITGRFG